MRYDIFISYSRKNRDRVMPLVECLRSDGYRVFCDQDDIKVADKWKDRLRRSIAASRVLILCWSKEAAGSEYVRYELFRAEGLNKPVLPWLIDDTELPKLIEIQGITESTPTEVLQRLKPRLGIQLRWKRLTMTIAAALIVCFLYVSYRWQHRPWTLGGIVRTTENESPLAGVVIEITTPDGRHYQSSTGVDGRYSIQIPLPQPLNVDMLFRKTGFESDHETAVTTTHAYQMYLKPLERFRAAPNSTTSDPP